MDHGFARAGLRHAFFCESDPWRRRVLARHWPDVNIYHDVRAVDGPPYVRLLAGGFPCQDVSLAGQRRGLAGARSGLFYEFARIAGSLRPRWVLVENVPGLLSSHGGRDFGAILGTLADIGYGLAWRILDSRFFGVPQRRRRVFIVGALADGDPRAAAERAGAILAVGSRCDRHPPAGAQTGQDASPPLRASAGRSGGNSYDADSTIIPSLSGLGSGGPDDNDGQAGRVISMALNAKRGNRDDGESETFISTGGVRRLTPLECERLQGLPDNWTRLDEKTPDAARYSALGDAVTANVAEWLGRRIAASG